MVWKLSEYVVLPFPGTFRDQPTWVRHAFLTLLGIRRWHTFNDKLPDASGFPRMDEID